MKGRGVVTTTENPNEFLKRHCEALGWSQAELARRADISQSYMNQFFTGERPVTKAQAAAIEQAFIRAGCDVEPYELYNLVTSSSNAADPSPPFLALAA